MSIRTINLEAGLPTVDEARKKLLEALQAAARDKVRALKIVHGYGSSGTGGKLRDGVRKSLSLRRKEGKVLHVCPGENWGPMDETARKMLEAYPPLKGDKDYGRGNYGVTIVLLA
jgi:hypothetical protein